MFFTKFNLPEKDLSDITEVKDYKCPECKNYPPDEYSLEGKEYPELYNEIFYSTMDGTIHNWTEVHKCPYCGKIFRFENGCF